MPELPIDEAQLIAGKYRVERVLGSGAMGVVVAAWHLELAQRVAVKFIRPESMTTQDAEARFRREARAAARIRSEHVGRVFDVGVTDTGLPYMLMEFLEGHDLSEELNERGPLSVVESVGHVLQAIEALAEAHAAGIIHRDLKPANLFLAVRPDQSRIVKVLDFGVSKAGESRPGDLALTHAASLIGSPLYMSPEQMRSARDVDGRSDIWSLGVILFELLAGRPPFVADSVGELMDAMLVAPPSIRSLRGDVPERLAQVIARCLKRNPQERFADVASLGQALVEFAPAMRVHAERARRVLRSADANSSDDLSLSATQVSTSSDATPGRPLRPTQVAWGKERGPNERRSLWRAVLIAALFAGLFALGFFALGPQRGNSAALSAASSTLATPVAPPTSLEPSNAAPAQSSAVSSPLVEASPRTASSATAAPLASAAKKAGKPRVRAGVKADASSAPVTPAESTVPGIPDFGGRR